MEKSAVKFLISYMKSVSKVFKLTWHCVRDSTCFSLCRKFM